MNFSPVVRNQVVSSSHLRLDQSIFCGTPAYETDRLRDLGRTVQGRRSRVREYAAVLA